MAFTSAIGAASVSAGNSKLVEALFQHSGAEVSLNTTVQQVVVDPAGGYIVTSTSKGDWSILHPHVHLLLCHGQREGGFGT